MNSRKKNNILSKIGKYTAVAGSVLFAHNTKADIVYTDIDPDTLITKGGSYDVDLNNDGIIDFNIENAINTSFNWVNFSGYFVGYNIGVYIYLSNLINSTLINSSLNFIYNNNGTIGWGSSGNYYGQFLNDTDAYIGFKFDNSGNTNFGWVRIDFNSTADSIIVKDYAYSDDIISKINAGELPLFADSSSLLVLEDISNNMNSTDLLLSFDAAQDESTVGEYRVFFVKSSEISSIDIDSARRVSNYYQVSKNGSITYSFSPGVNAIDVDNDTIQQGISYNAFVLSVPATGIATNHSLSRSNEVVLTYPADSVTDLLLEDVANNSTGNDLRFSFKKIENENSVSEYRVFVVKEGGVSSFDIEEAEINLYGLSILPIDQDILQVMPVTTKDTDGDLITKDVAYRFTVLSIGKKDIGVQNALSNFSNKVILNNELAINKNINDLIKMKWFNDRVYIESEIATLIVNSISLFDLNGNLIVKNKRGKLELNSQLPSGCYFLSINTNKGVLNKKIYIY